MRQQPPRQRAATRQLAGRRVAQLLELLFRPILLARVAGRRLFLHLFLGFAQFRVFDVVRNLVVFFAPTLDANVVLVRQREDVTAVVVLRSPGSTENLVRRRRVDQLFIAGRAVQQRRQNDRTRGQVDSGRQRLGANAERKEFTLEKRLDEATIFRQNARVVDADAA